MCKGRQFIIWTTYHWLFLHGGQRAWLTPATLTSVCIGGLRSLHAAEGLKDRGFDPEGGNIQLATIVRRIE